MNKSKPGSGKDDPSRSNRFAYGEFTQLPDSQRPMSKPRPKKSKKFKNVKSKVYNHLGKDYDMAKHAKTVKSKRKDQGTSHKPQRSVRKLIEEERKEKMDQVTLKRISKTPAPKQSMAYTRIEEDKRHEEDNREEAKEDVPLIEDPDIEHPMQVDMTHEIMAEETSYVPTIDHHEVNEPEGPAPEDRQDHQCPSLSLEEQRMSDYYNHVELPGEANQVYPSRTPDVMMEDEYYPQPSNLHKDSISGMMEKMHINEPEEPSYVPHRGDVEMEDAESPKPSEPKVYEESKGDENNSEEDWVDMLQHSASDDKENYVSNALFEESAKKLKSATEQALQRSGAKPKPKSTLKSALRPSKKDESVSFSCQTFNRIIHKQQ